MGLTVLPQRREAVQWAGLWTGRVLPLHQSVPSSPAAHGTGGVRVIHVQVRVASKRDVVLDEADFSNGQNDVQPPHLVATRVDVFRRGDIAVLIVHETEQPLANKKVGQPKRSEVLEVLGGHEVAEGRYFISGPRLHAEDSRV